MNTIRVFLLALVLLARTENRADAFSVKSSSLLTQTGRKVSNNQRQSPLFVSTLTKDAIDQCSCVPSIENVDDFPSTAKLQAQSVSFSEHLPDHYQQEDGGNDLSEFFDCYKAFAKDFPLVNNMMIASTKAMVADLFAQTAIAQVGWEAVDWQRTFLFCLFGAFYQGGFQYLYQVNVFSKIFDDVEKFTSQPWADKVRDGPGLKSLASQVALDLMIMSSIYLPTYYTFKASIFSDAVDPTVWFHDGVSSYHEHFCRDELDLLRVWLPADLVCFSAPLILRLPLRQIISLFYTAYLSAATFG